MRQMDADLMGASRFQSDIQKREVRSEPFGNLKMSHGVAEIPSPDGAFLRVAGMPADRRVHPSPLRRIPDDERGVDSPGVMRLKLT